MSGVNWCVRVTSAALLHTDTLQPSQEILGAYRLTQQETCRAFLRLRVSALAASSAEEIATLARHLEARRFPSGTEFDLMQQKLPAVYFVRSGKVRGGRRE